MSDAEKPWGPRLERAPATRTAAPAGPGAALAWVAAAAALIHALSPLSTLAERAGLAGDIYGLLPRDAAGLWLRLAQFRLNAGVEEIGLGVIVVVLFVLALLQSGPRLRMGVQYFAAAVALNALDWLVLGPNLLTSPRLSPLEHGLLFAVLAAETVLAVLLWIGARPVRKGSA